MSAASDITGEVTELLQHLIRNACVNDGTQASGQETRSAELLQSYLDGQRDSGRNDDSGEDA